MTAFALDCSIAMSWCFEDEATPKTDALLKLLAEKGAVVPSIWPLEAANVLLVAERNSRLNESQTLRLVNLLRSLPITVDESTSEQAMGNILSLGRSHHLSSYDAAYLELAIREGLPLATMDKKLIKAAKRCGVKTLPQ